MIRQFQLHNATLRRRLVLGASAVAVWTVLLQFAAPDVFQWLGAAGGELLLALLAAPLLWALPGLALLRWLWPANGLSALERLCFAACAGVALPPLLLLPAWLVGLPAGRVLAWALVAAGVGGLVWRRAANETPVPADPPLRWGLLGALLLATIVRLYVVRDLPAGLWADSYHHTMISQLIVDNGGIFSSWEPYAPLTSFTYHFGFHTNAAFLHWMTGISAARSVVLVGQLLNAVAMLGAYVLTTRMTGSQRAGLWAALLTAFVNLIPLYYVNWGRYTQLAGQVLLPPLILAWTAALERADWRRPAALSALLLVGLLLTHYLVAGFAALMIGSYVVVLLLRRPQWRYARHVVQISALIALVALLIVLPWLLNTIGGKLDNNVAGAVARGESGGASGLRSLRPIAPFFITRELLLLAAGGLLVALGRRSWRTALLGVWAALLVLVVAPDFFALPGAGVVAFLAAQIALYIPVIPLAGYLLGGAEELVARRWPQIAMAGAALVLLALPIWGVSWQRGVLDRGSQLISQDDLAAMEWAQANTPEDALFYVSWYPFYGGTILVGNDGGWWLPYFAERRVLIPPMLVGQERTEPPDYNRKLRALGERLRGVPLNQQQQVLVDLTRPEALEALREAGFDYIYVGRSAQGPVRSDLIDIAALDARPDLFQLRYDHAGIRIYQMVSE